MTAKLQLQWGSEIQPFKIQKHLKWLGLSYGYSYSPNHSKTRPFKIQTFLSRIQVVFDKKTAICLDFKWLGFRISDPIQNLDHVQPNLYSTIQNPD